MTAAFEHTAAVSSDHAFALLPPLTDLVLRAGAAIMAIPRDTKVSHKQDGSPVTPADLAADRVIAEGLAAIAPRVPVLSEECCGNGRPTTGSFFVVDPLDGTKEYIAGRDEFTVNLALVSDGLPVLGIVGAPALGLAWRGVVGHGAERLTIAADGAGFTASPIRTRQLPKPGLPWVATVSRSHLDAATVAFIGARPGAMHVTLGSSLKFCRIAEGEADIYPRLAPICEWDIAAGAAVVLAAGGKMTDASGAPLRFDAPRPNFIVPEFIAWGDRDGR
ncbi:3'(2'),5'-bisphosphate nucleotidase CysQ [Rhodopseudomonas sp. BR0M22]|uniref:3'(2'),5'-bisphosphate nucleotidase CysQ family protein n=1 Tax=Rhodopseudomonas sp. BR0M22 TaxID=2269369 RepID=UPI0013DF619F|nr:3'(2'),5'-bisphosphate nucleotidase CysQ [Rhodopseudomonas sp. BR0M22]NEW93591.1 3'(2'),5'-bisphosphate nucleotidase CysQ [Rhodopseudomonas sp. BR0M22]